MAALTETVKGRVDAATAAALERHAAAIDRKPSAILRIALREYLVRVGALEEAVNRGV